jgi:hypothetical protein
LISGGGSLVLDKLRRSRLARRALALLAVVAVGYFSNAVTAPACERATDRWLSDRLARNSTNSPGRRASSGSTEYRLPWVVAVDYEFVVGNLGGELGTRYYLSLLGLPLPIRDRIRMQS